jgi:hypothetical protein
VSLQEADRRQSAPKLPSPNIVVADSSTRGREKPGRAGYGSEECGLFVVSVIAWLRQLTDGPDEKRGTIPRMAVSVGIGGSRV